MQNLFFVSQKRSYISVKLLFSQEFLAYNNKIGILQIGTNINSPLHNGLG